MKKKTALVQILIFFALTSYAQIDFTPYESINIGCDTELSLTGDLNNDGLDDLVIATSVFPETELSYKLLVYIQNTQGLLDDPLILDFRIPNCFDPSAIDMGDFDNNGFQDIAIPLTNHVIIFYQMEDLVFSKQEIILEKNTYSLKAGDLNNDGMDDLVVTLQSSDSLIVLYQIGDGQLFGQFYPFNTMLTSIEIADMNDDGRNDLVLFGIIEASSGFFISLQDDNGLLQYPHNFSFDYDLIRAMTVGYLNDDNRLDLAITFSRNSPHAQVIILYQKHDQFDFESPICLNAYDLPSSIHISDLNCDGKNEIVVGHTGFLKTSVYEQNEAGLFSDFFLFDNTFNYITQFSLSIGDLNNDGRKDIITAGGDNIWTRLNNSSLPLPDTLAHPEHLNANVTINSYYLVVNTIDSLWNKIIIYTDSSRVDSITVDEYWRNNIYKRNIGELCSHMYHDSTLIQESYFHLISERVDTFFVSHSIDTIALSIDNHHEKIVSVFPNPSNGILIVELSDNSLTGYQIDIVNSAGIIVENTEIKLKSTLIDLSDQPAGFYLVVLSKNNKYLSKNGILIIR